MNMPPTHDAENSKCRGCDEPITSKNDSEAHVIPNALGGRLKPKGIICRTCNTALDDLADNALVRAFGAWPTLLDIPRDRGSNPSKAVTTRQGRRVRMDPDGTLTKTDVVYDVTPVESGHAVDIAAGDFKTFRQLLRRLQTQFPNFDPVAAERQAQKVGLDDDDQLKLSLDVSPAAVMGGAITAIWLFLIMKTGRTFMDWSTLQAVVRKMQSSGGTFRYLTEGLPGLIGPDLPIGHKLIVRSVPKSGELIAYVEILGVLRLGGVFAKAPAPSILIEEIYVHDVWGRADVSGDFSIEAVAFEAQEWRNVGLGPDDVEAVQAHFKSRLEDVFVRHYRNRFPASSSA